MLTSNPDPAHMMYMHATTGVCVEPLIIEQCLFLFMYPHTFWLCCTVLESAAHFVWCDCIAHSMQEGVLVWGVGLLGVFSVSVSSILATTSIVHHACNVFFHLVGIAAWYWCVQSGVCIPFLASKKLRWKLQYKK